MIKRLVRRLCIIVLWMVLSLGIYQCGARSTVTEEEHEKEEILLEDKKETLPMDNRIRVLIKTGGFTDIYHNQLEIRGTRGLYIERDKKLSEIAADKVYTISIQDMQRENITIRPKSGGRIVLSNVPRKEQAFYRGNMECFGTAQGIVIVNELTVEEYLYGVVPSEMPADYPIEALKAQAISARTYAYYHKHSYAYPEWKAHVDDSTAYQIYQNISENNKTSEAVDATRGLVVTYEDDLIESFYYSTSCGYSAGYEAWNDNETRDYLQIKELTIPNKTTNEVNTKEICDEEDFKIYIDSIRQLDIEKEEPWYRWQYIKDMILKEAFLDKIVTLSHDNPDKIHISSPYLPDTELSEESVIRQIRVTKRAKSGMATQLTILTEHFTVDVFSQYCIRQVLAKTGDVVIRQDGTEYVMGELLPSAYFYIESIYENNSLSRIVLHGGGMGHGAGLSQNGAKCLANMQYTAEEILRYFYNGIAVESIKSRK